MRRDGWMGRRVVRDGGRERGWREGRGEEKRKGDYKILSSFQYTVYIQPDKLKGRKEEQEEEGELPTSLLSRSAWVIITLSLSMATACLVVSIIPSTLVNIWGREEKK